MNEKLHHKNAFYILLASVLPTRRSLEVLLVRGRNLSHNKLCSTGLQKSTKVLSKDDIINKRFFFCRFSNSLCLLVDTERNSPGESFFILLFFVWVDFYRHSNVGVTWDDRTMADLFC